MVVNWVTIDVEELETNDMVEAGLDRATCIDCVLASTMDSE